MGGEHDDWGWQDDEDHDNEVHAPFPTREAAIEDAQKHGADIVRIGHVEPCDGVWWMCVDAEWYDVAGSDDAAATPHQEQPPPKRNEGVEVWPVAIFEARVHSDGACTCMTPELLALRRDMEARDRLGRERYGTPLQPHNGRDALRDLYEEILDAIAYATQVRLEAADDRTRSWALGLCERLRGVALGVMAARDAKLGGVGA